MDANQTKAIDMLMGKLCDVIDSGRFELCLKRDGFLNVYECKMATSGNPSNGHKIVMFFSVLKLKEGSWDFVIRYLIDRNQPEAIAAICKELAAELAAVANMEAQKSKPVTAKASSTCISVAGGYASAAAGNASSYQTTNPPNQRAPQHFAMSVQEKVKAINVRRQPLCEALRSSNDKLISFLIQKGVVDCDDQHVIARNIPSQQIIVTLDILKHKDKGWDVLMEFLSTNGYKWLADDLMSEAQAIHSISGS